MSAEAGQDEIARADGRALYGEDPADYAAGRPEYPPWVYERLAAPGGLGPGCAVIEVGPGSGLVTRRLLEAGARVVGVEPDDGFAGYLRDRFASAPLRIVTAPFEEADLPARSFDLLVAATSFHWVHREPGMAQIARLLRPGGHACLWWTLFFDRSHPDPFHEATRHLLPTLAAEFAEPGRPEFQLDVEQRCADLIGRAGLTDVRAEIAHWTTDVTTAQVRALYASMAVLRRVPPPERDARLNELARIADEDFGGLVQRPFVTALYLGQRP